MTELRIDALPATHPDAVALLDAFVAEVRARLGEFDPARSVSADPDEMAPPRGAFLVLYDGGAPVACGGIKTLEPGVAEVKRMFVAREARGRGHGRVLLAALEDAARAMGAARVVLDTAAPLVEAHRLYAASGYRDVAPYNANPYAARWFEKDLRATPNR